MDTSQIVTPRVRRRTPERTLPGPGRHPSETNRENRRLRVPEHPSDRRGCRSDRTSDLRSGDPSGRRREQAWCRVWLTSLV